MTATLILINGPPGIGKTTIARRYADEHPLTLRLDVDDIRDLISGWSDAPVQAGLQARALVVQMARTHLAEDLDVVISQLYGGVEDIARLERCAAGVGARFVEIMLTDERERAARRFLERGGPQLDRLAAAGDPLDGFHRLYDRVTATAAARPAVVVVDSAPGDVQTTYAAVLAVVEGWTGP